MEFYNKVKNEQDLNLMDTDFMSNEWVPNADDFLDSIFPLNNDLLKEFNDPDMELDINEIAKDLIQGNERISPISSEPEFNGFNGQYGNTMNNLDFTNMCIPDGFDGNKALNSSVSSDSGMSSDHLDLDMSPDYEPLSPSSPGPSISERGGQNSPPRFIQDVKIQSTNKMNKRIPKVIVEKVQSSDGDLMFNKDIRHVQLQSCGSPKEVKIFRVAPGQNLVGNNIVGNKKVTIQLKNHPNKNINNTVIINKNGNITNNNNTTGVRKLIRVQNPSNPRSILLPVSFQDVKDYRTIKIINSSNLKSKSTNVKLAAANLLQQSKQGLVQKNVLVSKEQLVGTDSDQTSDDCESFVFEDIMQQSSSVIQAAEHHQRKLNVENDDDDDDDDEDDDDDNMDQTLIDGSSYPKLILTNEEKRLLTKEGITLPTNYPLTKHEERELKRIRRKIRNKISAQDSRKRKKEYVDGLEERVKQCTDENQTLLKRIKILQTQNHNLMSQMKKLQTLLTKGTGKTAQPATCLMVLLLSMVLVAVPNLKLGQNPQESELADAIKDTMLMSQQNRRNLLFDTKEQFGDAVVDEELNLDDIIPFTGLNEHDYVEDVVESKIPSSVVPSKRSKLLIDFDVDDTIWNPGKKRTDQICHNSDSDAKIFNKEFQQQASIYQENLMKSSVQTSGFNINKIKLEEAADDKLDKEILDMMTRKPDDLYTINLENIASLSKQGNEINFIHHNKVIIDKIAIETKNKNSTGQLHHHPHHHHHVNNGRKLIV